MDGARAKRMVGELLGKTIGEWTLLDHIGTGRSALVFKAQRGDERGAVKIFDPELVDRFGEDIQAGRIKRQLSLRGRHHPNLVKIIDGGYCSGSNYWFVAMEFIDAPNLALVLQDVPRKQIWPLIGQVASAARFLEDLQFAHRDIKPANIAIPADFEKAVVVHPANLDSQGLAF